MFLSYIGASRTFAASEAAQFYASIIWRVANVRDAGGQNKPQDAKGLMPRQYMGSYHFFVPFFPLSKRRSRYLQQHFQRKSASSWTFAPRRTLRETVCSGKPKMRVHLPVLLGHILFGNASFSSPARSSFCLAGKMGRKNVMTPKARLDNIALVPASLLFQKGKYQTIANNLPGRGVLICEIEKKERISHILDSVAAFFRQRGHFVKTLPYSLM